MAINDVIRPDGENTEQPVGCQESPSQPRSGDQPNGEAPTEREQEAYDRVVMAGIQMLSDDTANDSIMQLLGNEQSGEPAKRLAKATVTLISEIDRQSNGTLPLEVVPPAAGELLENVGEFANAAGVLQVDQSVLDKATQHLIVEISELYGTSPEDIQNVLNEMPQKQQEEALVAQDKIANSGEPPIASGMEHNAAVQQDALQGPPQSPQVDVPQQPLPGIINRTVGT